jgi:hypothetical protein
MGGANFRFVEDESQTIGWDGAVRQFFCDLLFSLNFYFADLKVKVKQLKC